MAQVGTTHHLKLGTEFLVIRPNSYQKTPAPTFGARVSSGDPDYNNLSIWQHWVQKCWIGGIGADEWVDDAMFDEGVGVDTTVHERVTLSRTLKRGSGANWTVGAATSGVGYRFCVFNGKLYVLSLGPLAGTSFLYGYTPSTQAWASVALPGSFIARSIVTFDGKLFIGGGGGKLYHATTPGTWTLVTASLTGMTGAIYAMLQYNGKLYVSFTTSVYRMKDDQTWDGTTVFYKVNANSGSNYIQCMEVHLGFLYMLSQNGHLHRTDGNNTFDIWSWDAQTAGVSLRSYDGKLFVGTYEYTDTVDLGYGVLYQFTGAAVTELKRWGRDNKSTSIGLMAVYNRRLYYGAASNFGLRNGFGIAAYDSVEDAHSIWAVQDNTTAYPDTSTTGADWIVDDLIVFGGKMFCAVRKHGIFFTEDSFKDVALGRSQHLTSAVLNNVLTDGGSLTSSLYDAGTPGLLKLWRKITVFANLPTISCAFFLWYSLDDGVTWVATSPASAAGPVGSTNNQYVFYLNNVRGPSFKWRLVMKTTDETKTPMLRAVVVAYLPQPEPNWMWRFTIPVSDKWQLLDGTEEIKGQSGVKTTAQLIAYLEGLYRSQSLQTFIDINGVQWALTGPGVIVYDISSTHYDARGAEEGDIHLTLLETVETY